MFKLSKFMFGKIDQLHYALAFCSCCRFSHVQLFTTLWTVASDSSVHGILQARILEWVAMSASRGSSQPRD